MNLYEIAEIYGELCSMAVVYKSKTAKFVAHVHLLPKNIVKL